MQYRAGMQRMSGGLGDLAASFMGRGALEAQARREEERALADYYLRQQQGRKAGFEADIAGDELAHRQQMGDYATDAFAGQGITDPRLASSLAGLYRGSGGGAGALSSLMTALRGGNYLSQGVDAYGEDPNRSGMLFRAAGETPYEPYRATGQGGVLNQATGTLNEDSGLARAAIGATQALGDYRRSKMGGADEGGFREAKAADLNALARFAAPSSALRMLPNGEYYLEFEGDPQAEARHQAIVSRALQIWQSNPTVDHATAQVLARSELGFSTYDPNAPDPLRAAPAAQMGETGIPGAPPLAQAVPTAPRAIPTTAKKREELQNKIADIDLGLAAIDRTLPAISEGTGLWSAARSGINRATGQLQGLGAPLDTPFPDVAKSRADLRVLERELVRTLATNPRFPVSEQGVIRKLIPTPDEWLGDPANAMQRLRSLREFVVNSRRDAAGQLGVSMPDETTDFARVISTMPVEQLYTLQPELMSEGEREALSRRLDEIEQGGR